MHGLINKALQAFFTDSYGRHFWEDLTRTTDLGVVEFESLLEYPDRLTTLMLDYAETALERPRGEILEDLGTYLVAHGKMSGIRRLLRFCGATYHEFLHSLEELPGRAKLAIFDLELPEITVRERSVGKFTLSCHGGVPGLGHVLAGILRSLADDYGALVMVTIKNETKTGSCLLEIDLIDISFTDGNSFEFAQETEQLAS